MDSRGNFDHVVQSGLSDEFSVKRLEVNQGLKMRVQLRSKSFKNSRKRKSTNEEKLKV